VSRFDIVKIKAGSQWKFFLRNWPMGGSNSNVILLQQICSKHLSFLNVSSDFCHQFINELSSGRPMSRTSHDKIALLLNIYEFVLSCISECGVWLEWVLDDIWKFCTTGNQTRGSTTVMVEAPTQIRKTSSLISIVAEWGLQGPPARSHGSDFPSCPELISARLFVLHGK